MPRIHGVDVPNDKKIEYALCYITGIGHTSSLKILDALGIDPQRKAKDLSPDELGKIAAEIDRNYQIEGQLRRQVMQNINRLRKIGCYRGNRHIRGLPVRGQSTQCNARTRKGRKKTVATKRSIKQLR